ncbi:MAG: FAD-dependent oxidoreductase [Clostridia bacterium]|nr:FAD-dependent oxidoreductase [Clostridia bacterium]
MEYDVIIIGSGPAGISASLYTARANLKTLIISKGIGILQKVTKIDNYYGLETTLTGEELQEIGINQAKKLGVEFEEDEVLKIDYENSFIVETINSKYKAKSVIIATGTSRKTPRINGIKEYEGKGVSYCATCDAFFFRGKDVAVLGAKEYALHEAEELKRVANSVTILTNGEEVVQNRSNEFCVEEKRIKELRGGEIIEEIHFEDNTIKKIDGVFVAIGTASSSDLARKIGARIDEKGNILVNENMSTNVPNLYACGDCTGGILQIAKAVYEGMVAGMSVIKSVKKLI